MSQNTELAQTQSNAPVTSRVLTQIRGAIDRGSIHLPADYAPDNALKNAWLWIQNSDQRDALMRCTPESQINALHDMVLQCGDLSKKTGYMIAYGSKMIYQRSYFGEEALAKRVRPGIEIYSDVVYAGENLKIAKVRNRYGMITQIKEHEQEIPRKSKDIIACYVGIVDENGEDMGVELMDMNQILNSWKKSKQYNPTSKTFHNEQPDIACKRTVLRRRVKGIINTSTDAWLLQAITRQDLDSVAAEMEEEVAEKANGTIISLPTPQTPSQEPRTAPQETEPVSEDPPAQEAAQSPEETGREQDIADAGTPQAPKPVRLTLSKEEIAKATEYCKSTGQSYTLLKAAAERAGIDTFAGFMDKIAERAPASDDAGPGY